MLRGPAAHRLPAARHPGRPADDTADQFSALRDSILKNRPASLVGQVVITYGNLAAVKDIPLSEIKTGQTISFTDFNGAPVGNGTVLRSEDNLLTVRFESTGPRGVQKGDAAIAFRDGDRPATQPATQPVAPVPGT